jgi:hypothetical protein
MHTRVRLPAGIKWFGKVRWNQQFGFPHENQLQPWDLQTESISSESELQL